jgi:hypothetical protein
VEGATEGGEETGDPVGTDVVGNDEGLVEGPSLGELERKEQRNCEPSSAFKSP